MRPVHSARAAHSGFGKRSRDYSFAEVRSGFMGVRNDTTDPAKFYVYTRGSVAGSCWVGFVTGSEAYFHYGFASQNVFDPSVYLWVSVDGNVPTQAKLHSIQRLQLFKDLEDKKHLVAVWPVAGNNKYFDTTAKAQLTVIGSNPTYDGIKSSVTCGDFNPLTVQQSCLADLDYTAIPTGATPAKLPSRISSGYIGTNVLGIAVSGEDPGPSAAIRFKTASNYLVITSYSRTVFVGVDGQQSTRYDVADWNGDWGQREWPYRDIPGEIFYDSDEIARNMFGKGQLAYNTLPWVAYIKLDGQEHTYNVWTGSAQSMNQLFCIGMDGDLVDIGPKRRIDQFGDSITAGLSSSSGAGECEVHDVASHFGYVGCSHGYSGESTVNLNIRLGMLLQRFGHITSNDVAILAEGRNGAQAGGSQDGGGELGAISTTFPNGELTAYSNCVTQLLNRGYGKVLVRGVLPEIFPASDVLPARSWHWRTRNESIKAMVDSFNDPRVVYIDVIPFEGNWRATRGQTHPNDIGYKDLTELCKVAYAPYL